MRKQSIIAASVVVLLIVGGMWLGYKFLFSHPVQIHFKTQKPEKRDIHKIVHSEGFLEAQGTAKLGALINGIVKIIYVQEGQKVKKDALLADLENDKGGDTGVRSEKAHLAQAETSLVYLREKYKREKELYEAGELAQEAFEESQKIYKHAQAEVMRCQATYDKELFLLEKTHIRAPFDGTVIAINVKIGQTVLPAVSSDQVLFEIAEDLATMKAILHIDESKIGDITLGMPTDIVVDTYPYKKPWSGTISSIGMSKATESASQGKQSQTSSATTYKAEILINNAEGLLRPGMTVHATTTIVQVNQVLAVPGLVFQLNSKVLESIAKALHYAFNPIDPAKKKEFHNQEGKHPVKTLWVFADKAFTEKIVEIGVTDNAYFQIISGLQEADEIIADDMTASEEVKKIAKQFAGH